MPKNIAKQIQKKIKGRTPKTAIILGSGLGSLGDEIEDALILDYKDIKGFPQSTVHGHKGRLIIGKLNGVEVLCMQGRFHLYEGYPPQLINTIIKAFKLVGIENLIVTNAAGSLNKDMKPGSIMLISDHINFSGQNPLTGPNDEEFGPRFPDMSDAYCLKYREKIKKIASKKKIKLFEGTYFLYTGPNFETAAEIRAIKILGADATGMSTVPEVISAVHSGMKVLGMSVITNLATGLRDGQQSHAETLSEADKAANNLVKLVKDFVKEI